MSLIRFIFFFVVILILFRVIRYFIRSLNLSGQSNSRQSNNSRSNPKYKDVEEAKYIEVNDEPDKKQHGE